MEVALEEFGIPGRKQTNSRVSVLTGLYRKEVLRVTRLERPDDAEDTVEGKEECDAEKIAKYMYVIGTAAVTAFALAA